MLTRRKEREQAFVLFFEKSFNAETGMPELYAIALENEIIVKSEFVERVVEAARDNAETIDLLIAKHSKRWKIGRISKVALAALRLAICEIMFLDDVPTGVSINEAVELCKKYAAKDDSAFVNGVLSAVARELN